MANRDPHGVWVRFHSLPGSKRYADTDDERAEVLRRHHAVLDRLRDGAPLRGYEGELDEVLLAVADERAWDVTITDASEEWAYRPYDGGADVYARTTAERDALIEEFAEWLSARDDGL